MYKWLTKANPQLDGKYNTPKVPGLPNPNKCSSDVEAMAFQSANAAITNAILEKPTQKKGDHIESMTLILV